MLQKLRSRYVVVDKKCLYSAGFSVEEIDVSFCEKLRITEGKKLKIIKRKGTKTSWNKKNSVAL